MGVLAGVPQGSPLSPILFILYIASLYEALARQPGIVVCGFADDTNLLAFGRTDAETTLQLERAWGICETWAKTRGMQFEPAKSELIHFARAHRAPSQGIRLGNAEVKPTEETRFLGVWLDRKLRWRAHLGQ